MGRPRLQDVADLAGVSASTVSRVVNDVPGVSTTTRQAVRDALRALRYQGVGVQLARPRHRLVGLLVPELTNPVFPAFAQELESRLARHSCTTILATAREGGAAEDDYIALLLDQGIDGLVIVSGTHADVGADRRPYQRLADADVAVVLVNGMPMDPQWHDGWSSLSIDHERATRRAVEHLVELGHERVGLASGPSSHLPALEHQRGHAVALEQRGLPTELVRESDYGVEGGQAAANDLLGAGATGIVCGSDQMALGVIRAAQDRGMSVPADLSVVGFDDAGPWAFTDPPLTSTRQPVSAMTRKAVALLLAEPPRPERLWFRGELIVRGSTAAAPTT